MALIYDFDIFEVIPDHGPRDPQLDGVLSRIGFKPSPDSATVALFRDPQTAEALRTAPPGLRDFFLQSGFGLNTYTSGVPRGRYPAKDEAARLAVIERLARNACRYALPRPGDGAEAGNVFRLHEFLAALDQAEPIGARDAPVAHDLTLKRITPHDRALPPVFETDPDSDRQADLDPPPTPRKFWQSRFFRRSAAAALVLGLLHLVKEPAVIVLASL